MKPWKRFCREGNKPGLVLALAAALMLAATVASLCLGAVPLSPWQLWRALCGKGGMAGHILWLARVPRTAACLLAGAALAVAGAVLQSVLSNQLASPNIIGVNAGAGLAVTVCCAAGAFSSWVIAGAAFVGALGAVLLVMLVAQKAGQTRATVLLSGVAVNAFLNAIAEGIRNLVPDAAALSADFRVGGFSSVISSRLSPAGLLIVIALALVLTLCNELDVMALGEEAARGLGVSVRRMRMIFLLLATMLAGASVSFAGLLGFVGLIVPHAARRLVGGESRRLLPLCAIGGAGFVTACDLLTRLVFAPYELPVGILMSVLGGPFFVALLWKRGGRPPV